MSEAIADCCCGLAGGRVGAGGLREFPFGGGNESEERSMDAPAATMAPAPAVMVEKTVEGERMSRDTATAMGMAAGTGRDTRGGR